MNKKEVKKLIDSINNPYDISKSNQKYDEWMAFEHCKGLIYEKLGYETMTDTDVVAELNEELMEDNS